MRIRQTVAPKIFLSLSLLAACGSPTFPVLPTEGLEGFEADLDGLRVELQIPGMSAAIVQDGQTVWTRGLGYADLADEREATPTTSFHLASLTKTFAAIVIMQLVEEGRLDLDTPVSQYDVDLPNGDAILVRHLMTHTSEGVPGAAFKYNGNRFGELGTVIDAVSDQSFGELLVNRILRPLNLSNTAPNVEDDQSFSLTGLDRDDFVANMAVGYEVVEGGVSEQDYPTGFNPAAGLISSAEDMATYAIAIDGGRFLEQATWNSIFEPGPDSDGNPLAYGLGWFVHDHEGIRLLWHYGWWTAIRR